MTYTHSYDSPIGRILLASDGSGLTGLWFENSRYFAEGLTGQTAEKNDLPIFAEADRWLDTYFSGKKPEFLPPLHACGSDFRRDVWQILLKIPYGHTRTYGDIAAELAAERGLPGMSAQAVGGAVGHNPISIMIPCHRVVGANGSLTGYGGGIGRKVRLLKLESADMSGLFVPKKGTAL